MPIKKKIRNLTWTQGYITQKKVTFDELYNEFQKQFEIAKNCSRKSSERGSLRKCILLLNEMKNLIIKYIDECPFIHYQPYTGGCYFLANHLKEKFGGELYCNHDHVILHFHGMYFDKNGEVDFKKQDPVPFIPIDPLQEERYKKILQTNKN